MLKMSNMKTKRLSVRQVPRQLERKNVKPMILSEYFSFSKNAFEQTLWIMFFFYDYENSEMIVKSCENVLTAKVNSQIWIFLSSLKMCVEYKLLFPKYVEDLFVNSQIFEDEH